jgi:hydrogenase maturation factor
MAVDSSTPIAFAVLRLMTSSNFAACSTGRSAGFAPLSILDTVTGIVSLQTELAAKIAKGYVKSLAQPGGNVLKGRLLTLRFRR